MPYDTQESERNFGFCLGKPNRDGKLLYCNGIPWKPTLFAGKNSGIALPTSYAGYSQHSYETLNLGNDYVSAAEILKFRDEAWTEYHSNPKYLELLGNKFGDKAVNELTNTKKISLKRKILEVTEEHH